ncbi:aspartate--tRNA(Asn) ligase [Candidatus Bathyarchaeota archaeon ex4484_205]|nr:MAG: aspartate--tRNA(Asn) ligase [Candidatus Bathyarchaeota archaeon ex4484_205]
MEIVRVAGWVFEKRDLGGIIFILLRDSTGIIQVTWSRKRGDKEIGRKMKKLKINDVIEVRGEVKKEEQAPNGVEIIPHTLRVLNEAEHPLPLDPTGKIDAGLETRLNLRPLDLINPKRNAIFRIKSEVLRLTREFLRDRGFLEVITPKIIATATEGGAELFPVPYFEVTAFLAQSPQLYKEELTIPFERVFEIGTYFRAEPFNTNRHLNEFVSIDIEAAFHTYEDVMKVAEELIVHVYKRLNEGMEEELKLLNLDLRIPQTPFPRVKYDEIMEKLRGIGVKIESGEDIKMEHLESLKDERTEGYYFIIDWPSKVKTFYTKDKEDREGYTNSFDLMYRELEIGSGGERIHKYNDLIKKMRKMGLSIDNFRHHLVFYKCGMPPHAGWGIGLDRLMMSILGFKNIRETVLYPRDRFRLVP